MVIYRVFFYIALAKAAEAATRQKEAEEKAALNAKNKAEKKAAEQAAKEEERLALAEMKAKLKKKAVRYPTEDLEVRITDRDKKSGMKERKPIPSRSPEKVPFNETKGTFEGFLAVWNFLIGFG